ncbi:MAG: four helix bundle protein, partial [Lentimicrobium sp.]|nr:four helix bundle protein [Lentimicrobium sp.]
ACSNPDFINKVRISLKEMRETNYWLRIIKRTNIKDEFTEELNRLVDESEQLKKILGSIIQKKMAQTNDV